MKDIKFECSKVEIFVLYFDNVLKKLYLVKVYGNYKKYIKLIIFDILNFYFEMDEKKILKKKN